MPFRVRRFPNSQDPREATFCIEGFAWGGTPAIVYRFSTLGALAPFNHLNGAGVVLGLTSDAFGHHEWSNFDLTIDHLFFSFEVVGAFLGIDPGPTYSIEWSILTTAPGEDVYAGIVRALYPDAIDGWPTIALSQSGSGPNKIPNPILVTPCIWSTPLTP